MIISNEQAIKVLEALTTQELTDFYNHVFEKNIKKIEVKPDAIKKIMEANVFETFALFDGQMSFELSETLIATCDDVTGVYFKRDSELDPAFIRKRGVGKFIQDQIFGGTIDSDEIVARIRENDEFKKSTAAHSDVAFVKTQLRKAGFFIPSTQGRRKSVEVAG